MMSQYAPSHDSTSARMDRIRHSNKSYCFRCGFTWATVKGHATWYNDSNSCFPLCEGCWTDLAVPEARIEYYGMLIRWWNVLGPPVSKDTEFDIKRAVANGG